MDLLHTRDVDDCYSAFHWLENFAAKQGLPNMFPEMDPNDPVWLRAGMPKEVVALVDWNGIPDKIKELALLGMEWMYRELVRKAGTKR